MHDDEASTREPRTRSVDADLRARGMRPTEPRRLILSTLRSTTAHPSADEIHSTLTAEGHDVGLATVYQNLARLADEGLVLRFVDSRGVMHFDADVSPHHHLLCAACGTVEDVRVTDHHARHLERTTTELAGDHPDWELADVRLELRGFCPDCRADR